MTLSTGISPQLYLLVAALAEDLNGKRGRSELARTAMVLQGTRHLYKRASQ